MNSALAGVRVLEWADERGEFAGKLLAGLGADVLKVEPPEGETTRRIGPFYEDRPDPDRSLSFWHYNQGKRGVTLDRATPDGTWSGWKVVTRPGSRAGVSGRYVQYDVTLAAAQGGLPSVRAIGLTRSGGLTGHPVS